MEKSNRPINPRSWDTSFFKTAGLLLIALLAAAVPVNAQPANTAHNGSTIILPDGVTNIEFGAYSYHHDLKSITIPKTVLSIGKAAFHSCIQLTAINVDPLNPNFSSMDGILFNKDKTRLIQYPGARAGAFTVPDSVATIDDNAFSELNYLTDITIPDHVTTIEWHAFMSCIQLTNVTIGSGVIAIGGDDSGWLPFNGCSKLRLITVSPLNWSFSSVDGVLFNKSKTKLIKYPEAKTDGYEVPAGVAVIGRHAFSGATHLTSVTIPDSVTTIEDNAFENCNTLTNVILGKGVTSIAEGTFTSWQHPSPAISVDGQNPVYGSKDGTFYDRRKIKATAALAGAVSIKEPTNNASINARWVDVQGTFAAKNLKQITVGSAFANPEMPASINGTTFEARNVFLGPGTNIIMAIAEDMDGNTGTNAVLIMGPTDTNTARTFPVRIQTSTIGGFVPLPVTFTVQAHVPGKVQKVIYDFDGDNLPDKTSSDLQPVTHIYKTSGVYLPIITIKTTVGQFSSPSEMFGVMAAGHGNNHVVTTVNVQMLPVLISTLKIIDPVKIRWTATSNLYVLSGSTGTITEFEAKGAILRSLSGIGANLSGMEVDENGNVYVTGTVSNQVFKFKPTANSFEADIEFSNNVAVESNDGSTGKRGRYVADPENNRVQVLAPPDRGGELRLLLSGELGLKNPKSVAAVDDFLEEKLYIADTGNNRVILVKLPAVNPDAVWKHMIARLKAGDVQGAMSDFSVASKDQYQQMFQSLSKDELLSTVKDMENIKPATIESDRAQYYFESIVKGQTITFPVEFGREFGKWKIMEF